MKTFPPQLPASLKRFAIFGAAYLAVFACWLCWSFYGFNPWDESVLAYGGLRVQQGQKVGIDFFGYAPGRYFLAALSYQILGVSLFSVRVFTTLLLSVMPLLGFAIARRFLPFRWSLAAAFLILWAPGAYYSRFYPLVALLGGWSLLRLLEAPSRKRQLAHGLCLGLCFLLKTPSAAFVALLSPVALWLSPSPWLEGLRRKVQAGGMILLGALLAVGPFLEEFLSRGVFLASAATQTQRYVVGGASLWVPYPRPWEFIASGHWGLVLEESLFWVLLLTLLLTALWMLVNRFWGQRHFASQGNSHAAEAGLVVLWLLAGLNFLLPLYRAGFFNVLRAAPLSWILFLVLLHALGHSKRHSGNWRAWLRGGLAGLCLLYGPVLMGYLTLSPTYRNLSTGGPGGMLSTYQQWPEDSRARVWMEPRHIELLGKVQRWLNSATLPTDKIFAAPLNPMFYFFGRRDNATAHDYVLPGYWKNNDQLAETLELLEEKPPLVFLYFDVSVDGDASRRFLSYSWPLFQFFAERYAWVEKHLYPLSSERDAPVFFFRLLRPAFWWQNQKSLPQSPGLQVLEQNGPVAFPEDLPTEVWRLGPESSLQAEVRPGSERMLLFRFHSFGSGAWWTRPQLRVRWQNQKGFGLQEIVLKGDPALDRRVPPWVAIALPETEGPLQLRLDVEVERQEQLHGYVELLSPGVWSRSQIFFAPGEAVSLAVGQNDSSVLESSHQEEGRLPSGQNRRDTEAFDAIEKARSRSGASDPGGT